MNGCGGQGSPSAKAGGKLPKELQNLCFTASFQSPGTEAVQSGVNLVIPSSPAGLRNGALAYRRARGCISEQQFEQERDEALLWAQQRLGVSLPASYSYIFQNNGANLDIMPNSPFRLLYQTLTLPYYTIVDNTDPTQTPLCIYQPSVRGLYDVKFEKEGDCCGSPGYAYLVLHTFYYPSPEVLGTNYSAQGGQGIQVAEASTIETEGFSGGGDIPACDWRASHLRVAEALLQGNMSSGSSPSNPNPGGCQPQVPTLSASCPTLLPNSVFQVGQFPQFYSPLSNPNIQGISYGYLQLYTDMGYSCPFIRTIRNQAPFYVTINVQSQGVGTNAETYIQNVLQNRNYEVYTKVPKNLWKECGPEDYLFGHQAAWYPFLTESSLQRQVVSVEINPYTGILIATGDIVQLCSTLFSRLLLPGNALFGTLDQ